MSATLQHRYHQQARERPPGVAEAELEPLCRGRHWRLSLLLAMVACALVACGDQSVPLPAPPPPPGPVHLAQISVGYHHACARYSDGSMRCWGNALYGALGAVKQHGDTVVDAKAVGHALDMHCYSTSTCSVLPDRTVGCWGNRGEHGRPDEGASVEPFSISPLTNVRSLGYLTALHEDGTVSWWGHRYKFGNNPVAQSLNLLEAVVQLAHADCALIGDGTVRCWGANDHGQVGDGTRMSREPPYLVKGLDGVVQIAGRCQTRCAARLDGDVWCWGENFFGQLGNGTTEDGLLAAKVPGISGVSKVAVGCAHVCALLETGSVHCWGEGRSGELGDGARESRPAVGPPVADLTDVIDIAPGGASTCVIRSDDTAWCWGADDEGVLGDSGGKADGATPSKVEL